MISLSYLYIVFIIIGLIGGGGSGEYLDYTYYVSSRNGSDASDCGVGWSNACIDLHSAVIAFTTYTAGIGSNVTSASLRMVLEGGVYQGVGNTNIELFGYNVSIVAYNETQVVFDGSGSARILQSTEPITFPTLFPPNTTITSVSVSNIIFRNGYADNVTASTARGSGGGAIYFYTNQTLARFSFTNCTFTNNSVGTFSQGQGGAIRGASGVARQNPSNATLVIDSCIFTNNTAYNNGGAINLESTDITVTNSQFTQNRARMGSGGAIATYGLGGSISNSNFTLNRAGDEGGAIITFDERSLFTNITSCLFVGNSCPLGGAVAVDQAYNNIVQSNFTGNSAPIAGGAVYLTDFPSYVSISLTQFFNNTSTKGGAVRIEDDASFVFADLVFNGNSASSGGSISFSHSDGSISRVSIVSSTSSDDGGAIYTTFGRFSLTDVTIANNSAQQGAAIYCSASRITFTSNVTITDNIDIPSSDSSDQPSTNGEILPNDYNIYCGIDPPYTFCNFTGLTPYNSLCGEVPISEPKGSLSGGQIAGIAVGSILGASVLAFALGALLVKKTDIRSYFQPLIRATNSDLDESDS